MGLAGQSGEEPSVVLLSSLHESKFNVKVSPFT